MRNTFGKLCVIFGTLLLLFAVAFTSIALVLKDSDYIEDQYQKQNVSEQMGMSVPDLSAATDVLLEYMRGERENIRFGARVNGAEIGNIFYHEKEVVHMAEVQSLWLGLSSFSRYAMLAGIALLILGGVLPERGKKRAVFGSGVIWGAGVFGGVLAFFGVWAIMNFQSFWTVFHFIIFPASLFQYLAAGATPTAMNELNWVLPNDSMMVNMLMPIFPPLVMRCGIFVIAEIVFALLIGLLIRFIGHKKVSAAVEDIVTVERDTDDPVVIDGPDLVLAHQLRNAPVSKREELKRRAEAGLPLFDPPKKKEEPKEEPAIELRDDAPVCTPPAQDDASEESAIELRDGAPEPNEDAEPAAAEEPAIELRDAASEPEGDAGCDGGTDDEASAQTPVRSEEADKEEADEE